MFSELFHEVLDISKYQLPSLSNLIIFSLILLIFHIFLKLSFPLEIENNLSSEKFTWIHSDPVKRFSEVPEESIFPNGWIPVLESHELLRNKIKPITACGKDLVVYRGASGKCYVFDAYCPHLGANLGIGGTIVGESVQCPFHGWVFNQTGKCTHIPGIESSTMKAELNKYQSLEVNDLIFIWNHPTITDPEWFPEEHSKMKTERAIYRGKFIESCTLFIQDFFENGADAGHTKTLHTPSSFVGNLEERPKYFDLVHKIFHYEWSLNWKSGSTKHTSNVEAVIDAILFGRKIVQIVVHARIIGPSLIHMFIEINAWKKFEFYYVDAVIQTVPFNLKTINKFYSKPGILHNILSRFLIIEAANMMKRDVVIWANKKYYQRPIFTKNEKDMLGFRRWYKQFLNDKEIIDVKDYN